MEERSRVLLATMLGAVAGGRVGLAVSDRERARACGPRSSPSSTISSASSPNVRGTVEKARTAANEGWRSLNDITGGAAQGRWSA